MTQLELPFTDPNPAHERYNLRTVLTLADEDGHNAVAIVDGSLAVLAYALYHTVQDVWFNYSDEDLPEGLAYHDLVEHIEEHGLHVYEESVRIYDYRDLN